MGTLFNPWPDDDQRLRIELRTHSFDSQVEFLNGSEAGATWGINAGKGWIERGGQRSATDNTDLQFMLPHGALLHGDAAATDRSSDRPLGS